MGLPTAWATPNVKNQIVATNTAATVVFDAVGNVLDDGNQQYKYDAENRVCAVYRYHAPVQMTQYIYDALGNRIAKGSMSVFNCDRTTNGFAATSNYVNDQNGEQLDENDGSGTNLVHSNVFANGRLLATYNGSAWLYSFNDWLGTKRAQITSDGNITNLLTFGSLPYGDGLTNIGGNATEQHFTGKERDNESQNEYFEARYYSSGKGRFLSPDNGVDQDASNPQSWNLYGYVQNNPVTNTDSDGHSVNVCTYDTNFPQQCTLLGNDQYAAASQGNGSLNVPTLDQVGMNGNGSGQFYSTSIRDANGTVGTATYVSDGGADYYAYRNGFNTLANTSQVVKAGTAIYAGVYGAVGVAIAGPPVAAATYRFILQRLALSASSPALLAAINKLYQEQDEISGGTAGAVRNEVATGEFINGGHSIKAGEMINRLNNLIQGGLDSHDRNIAERLISDLKNSLGR